MGRKVALRGQKFIKKVNFGQKSRPPGAKVHQKNKFEPKSRPLGAKVAYRKNTLKTFLKHPNDTLKTSLQRP